VRIVWTLGAQEDARALVIERASHSRAAASRLADFPKLGMPAGGNHRHLLIMGGEYRLIHREDTVAIRILGVMWGSSPWSTARS
jgi:plasmid stabilization system protein ParE